MMRFLVVALLVVAACSGSASGDNRSSPVCTAIAGLNGNGDDFKTMTTADRAEDAYAAIDRMSERARSAIASLQAIDGPIGFEASKLAAVEQGLLPILEQFRNVGDQAGWTTARDAYTRWYNQSVTVITDVSSSLGALGVHCG